jgi:hypothetical protein
MHKYYFSYYWYLNLTLSQGMETDLGYNNLWKYSNDSDLNLMIPPGEHDQGMYDYIIPIKGFVQPSQIKRQITPIREAS